MSNHKDYSQAELKVIKAISSHWYDVIHKIDINEPALYAILALECFSDNRNGPEVDALRRACSAIGKCKPYRMTLEFDKLCEF